jgi:hypothetical protein
MKFTILTLASIAAMVSADGIQFSRTVNSITGDSDFQLKFDAGCSSTDDYGSNNCNFAWGSNVAGSVNGNLGHDLETGSTFAVNLKIDRVVSWKFSCAACGSNCTTSIPVINQDVNFAMPDCPITAGELAETIFNQDLPVDSPTKGVKVTAVGTINVLDAKGASVIGLGIDATIQ